MGGVRSSTRVKGINAPPYGRHIQSFGAVPPKVRRKICLADGRISLTGAVTAGAEDASGVVFALTMHLCEGDAFGQDRRDIYDKGLLHVILLLQQLQGWDHARQAEHHDAARRVWNQRAHVFDVRRTQPLHVGEGPIA